VCGGGQRRSLYYYLSWVGCLPISCSLYYSIWRDFILEEGSAPHTENDIKLTNSLLASTDNKSFY